MATSPASRLTQVGRFVLDNSLLLLTGAAVALVWANVAGTSYTRVASPLRFAVNDVGMVFFFAIAMKKVVVAMRPGGPLGSFREAGLPVIAAVGGMAGPAVLFTVAAHVLERPDILGGWAIPCATDIAFSYLAARLAFRGDHPAIPFLLFLAIADDALGLIVLALFYPAGPTHAGALALYLGPAIALAWVLRRRGVRSFWWYLLGPGALSWIGLYLGGIHPALALVPIVPFMLELDSLERWWRIPVEVILFGFGFVNAGVPLSSVGPITWVIAGSLIVGKPFGIVLTTMIAEVAGFRRAPGLDYRGLVTLGIFAGIGFTVALFFAMAAFPPGAVLDQAKMGALFSFAAAALGIACARVLGIKPEALPRASSTR
jgi:NhaA family Na+:H+ antiporter